MITFIVVIKKTGLKARDPHVGQEKKAYREVKGVGCSPKDAFALGSQ
jgi:hypothetical protein